MDDKLLSRREIIHFYTALENVQPALPITETIWLDFTIITQVFHHFYPVFHHFYQVYHSKRFLKAVVVKLVAIYIQHLGFFFLNAVWHKLKVSTRYHKPFLKHCLCDLLTINIRIVCSDLIKHYFNITRVFQMIFFHFSSFLYLYLS